MRRMLASALATATAITAAVIAGPANQAAALADTCTAHAVLPPRITVTQEFLVPTGTSIYKKFTGPASEGDFISGSYPLMQGAYHLTTAFDEVHGTLINYNPPHIHANLLRPGNYQAPGGAHSIGSTCSWALTNTVIKFGGNAGIGSTRSGSVVTLSGLFHEYRAGGFSYPVGQMEYLQRYQGGAWANIATAAVQPGGRASVSFIDASVGEYRWISRENPLTFGYNSPIGFR